MDTNTVLIILLAIGTLAVWAIRARRVADGEALFWATANQPFVVISRYPTDDTVLEEVAYIRSMLTKHGNQYLHPDADVWSYCYATDVGATADFNLFTESAYQDAARRREVWRLEKIKYTSPSVAAVQFGGQRA